MKTLDESGGSVHAAVESILGTLTAVRHWPDCSFVNLPLIYPGGDNVTVRIDRVKGGFRVSDNGFAFRQAEAFGSEDSFARLAKLVVDEVEIERGSQAIFADVEIEALYSAVCDVSAASWRVAERLCVEADEDDASEDDELLTLKLRAIFGSSSVEEKPRLIGASTNPWPMTAMVHYHGKLAAFQMVVGSAYSVYRTSSAFSDIADLEKPPGLVAVVSNIGSLGKKLGLLSRMGRVIEQSQPDADYVRAAA